MASTGLTIREDEWKIVTGLVLDGISSCHTRRAYSQALDEFLIWFRDEPNRQFNKAKVQKYRMELEVKGLAPSSINVRLSAIRRLALEASDNGRLDPELAAGIARAKGAKRSGVRLGHWLTAEQAQALLAAPDLTTVKGLRDSALLALLLGAGLRRAELASINTDHIQLRDGLSPISSGSMGVSEAFQYRREHMPLSCAGKRPPGSARGRCFGALHGTAPWHRGESHPRRSLRL